MQDTSGIFAGHLVFLDGADDATLVSAVNQLRQMPCDRARDRRDRDDRRTADDRTGAQARVQMQDAAHAERTERRHA